MRNYVDAAIHMPKDSPECQIIIPVKSLYERLKGLPVRPTFDELIVTFLDAWSKELLALPNIAEESGLLTFAFWIRRAHIESVRKHYALDQRSSLGRGLVFHVASTNMPLNPGYTLAVGLLAGNANIVKLATRHFSQTESLIETLQTVLQDPRYREIADSIGIVRYDATQTQLTDGFSKLCDVRLIWGGDETIELIRTSPISVNAYEITFPERYSMCVIGTDDIEEDDDFHSIAQGLYNDIYLFDQNAFTAPHLIVWLATDEVKRDLVKDRIMKALSEIVSRRYPVDAAVAADKMMILCREAIETGACVRTGYSDNRLIRIQEEKLSESIYDYKGIGGLLHEYDASSLEELAPFIDSRVQTFAYHGMEKSTVLSWVSAKRIAGIDRIVPIGQTADFNSVWDGFDLVRFLSRIIT